MYFFYLPRYVNFATDVGREFALRTATELNIPVTDMYGEVFVHHPDPLSLTPFDGGHYNAEGYRLVAEAIAKRLKTDGFFSINSNN